MARRSMARWGAGAVVLAFPAVLSAGLDRPWSPPAGAGLGSLAHAGGPPPGHTGGFGEPSCAACHSEFDLNLGGSLTLEGLPSRYEPGRSYVVSVVLRSTEMQKAGFQAIGRFAEAVPGEPGRQAGTLEALDPRTAVVPDSLGALRYVQQAAAGSDVHDPSLATWSFQWTAPREGGAVVFHAAANSANGDNSPLGDLVYTTEIRLEPTSPSGL